MPTLWPIAMELLVAGVAGVIAALLHQASDMPDSDLESTLTPELEELCVIAPSDRGQLHTEWENNNHT